MEKSSLFKNPCTKIHGQVATDDVQKIGRDHKTMYFLRSAKKYDFLSES